MRYLVRARVRRGQEEPLLKAIEDGTLGEGSIAEGEYLRNMGEARVCDGDVVKWVEVCYCPTPLLEETPYWEEYFELVKVRDAHDRSQCRDQNGSEPWACGGCDCTERLEHKLAAAGKPLVDCLRAENRGATEASARSTSSRQLGKNSSVSDILTGHGLEPCRKSYGLGYRRG